jgi:DNA-binding transcriptional regulator GbsR (MarR family)
MKNGLLEINEAIKAAKTNRSTFLRAVVKLNIPNIKIPNDRKRYYRPEHVEQIRQHIYKDKEVIESPHLAAA